VSTTRARHESTTATIPPTKLAPTPIPAASQDSDGKDHSEPEQRTEHPREDDGEPAGSRVQAAVRSVSQLVRITAAHERLTATALDRADNRADPQDGAHAEADHRHSVSRDGVGWMQKPVKRLTSQHHDDGRDSQHGSRETRSGCRHHRSVRVTRSNCAMLTRDGFR
jgi:hypothetical protein